MNPESPVQYRLHQDVERLQSRLASFALAAVERQQVEQALRESEERFRTIIEHAADAFFVSDLKGKYVTVNGRACEYTGYSREELLTKYVWDLSEAITPAVLVRHIETMVRDGSITVEAYHRRKDGSTYPIELRASIIETGGERRIHAFVRDVTERHHAEEALAASNRRFATVLNSAMDAIIIIDEDFCVTLFNSAAEKVFRCNADDVEGTSVLRFFRSDFETVLKSQTGQNHSEYAKWLPDGCRAQRADGEEFPVEATVSTVEIGGTLLHTIILRDVHERQRAWEAIQRLKLETIYLRQEIETDLHPREFVGVSHSVEKLLRDVDTVAPSGSTVLIVGETGTGKELIARAIHRQSTRKDKALVKVNCAALPEGLIESELFGHEKGAFTGASTRKMGRFELAHLGTIFLDEIGELSLDMQAKLLRVLQEGEFERVGGSRVISADVRVIAATNRNLHEMLEQGRFREDLFYRLNVVPLAVPPLRDRPDDIPRLVSHFVMKCATAAGKKIESVPKNILDQLIGYAWPGNVRELQNLIERAVLITDGPDLQFGDWLPKTRNSIPTRVRTLDEVNRDHILAVLTQTGWRVSGSKGAAELLGIKPTTLEARMQKLGIRRGVAR